MNIDIIEIKDHPDGKEIKAVVRSGHLPRPDYNAEETDEQYALRVADIATDIEGFFNLHLGRAKLRQVVDKINIPRVEEYDT